MNEFLKAIQNRRSVYGISSEPLLANDQLQELVETAVNHVPSAFNSQTSRVLLLTAASHAKLWSLVLLQLKNLVPADKFASTKEKIDSFAAGYGTVLYFEEQGTIENLQAQFPLYADNFPVWSQQSSGMLQFAIWSALELEGYGASLQHYNPLIDSEVAKAFDVPKTWKLIAQMPFGKPVAPSAAKTFLPIATRVQAYHELPVIHP